MARVQVGRTCRRLTQRLPQKRSTQGPPGAHVWEAGIAPPGVLNVGTMKVAICSPISGSGGRLPNPRRLPNAAHCVCFERSWRKSEVSASGAFSGSGVRLRSKVLLTEWESCSRSKR